MAWTSPLVWTTGLLVTAAQMNTYVSDNLDFLNSPPGARAYHSADQAVTTATDTKLSFDSERFDNDTIHDTATNNSRLTCQTAGKYLIIANVRLSILADGVTSQLWLLLNNTTIIGFVRAAVGAGGGQYQIVTTIYNLAVTNYVEVVVRHDAAGAEDIVATGNYSPEFMMMRLSG